MDSNNRQSGFTFLWTVACLWMPLLQTIFWQLIDRPSAPTTVTYILGGLGTFTLFIVAMSQLPLLVGRVERSWLWIVVGLVAVIVEMAVRFLLFELSRVLPQPLGDWLYYILPVLAAGLAMAAAQAIAMQYWRLDGKSWFGLSCGAFIAGFLVLLLADQLVTGLVPGDHPQFKLVQSVAKMLGLWSGFGVITGWHMWRRLNDGRLNSLMAA